MQKLLGVFKQKGGRSLAGVGLSLEGGQRGSAQRQEGGAVGRLEEAHEKTNFSYARRWLLQDRPGTCCYFSL
jgi:hypothetical protein